MFGRKRSAEELSVEELERLLLLKKREERAQRLRRLASEGRVVQPVEPPSVAPAPAPVQPAQPQPQEPAKPETRGPRRLDMKRLREQLLLAVEVLALVGLVVILAGTFLNLQELNRDVVEASGSNRPTPTATALIEVRVLPGGHEPPVPGREPVPSQYQHLVSPEVQVPIPTPGPEQPTRIVIPAINVDARVVEGDGWEQLKKGAGHRIGSANPGERGNCVISAHNDIYGEIFRDLHKLELEDEIIVYAGAQPYRYKVVAKRIIEPTQVEVMDPTPDPILTLITCYPYRIDTHRIVVIAALVQ
ncbi:MAG: class D sortase [Anaerolineae bacterium]|nr:class D sortase [Anaerolineae bacterium]